MYTTTQDRLMLDRYGQFDLYNEIDYTVKPVSNDQRLEKRIWSLRADGSLCRFFFICFDMLYAPPILTYSMP